MDLLSVHNQRSPQMIRKAEKRRSAPKVSTPKREYKDTYEPTKKIEDREELIKQVKKRIKSGFYNSKKVTDDLSDSFADIFNNNL